MKKKNSVDVAQLVPDGVKRHPEDEGGYPHLGGEAGLHTSTMVPTVISNVPWKVKTPAADGM